MLDTLKNALRNQNTYTTQQSQNIPATNSRQADLPDRNIVLVTIRSTPQLVESSTDGIPQLQVAELQPEQAAPRKIILTEGIVQDFLTGTVRDTPETRASLPPKKLAQIERCASRMITMSHTTIDSTTMANKDLFQLVDPNVTLDTIKQFIQESIESAPFRNVTDSLGEDADGYYIKPRIIDFLELTDDEPVDKRLLERGMMFEFAKFCGYTDICIHKTKHSPTGRKTIDSKTIPLSTGDTKTLHLEYRINDDGNGHLSLTKRFLMSI